MEPDVLDHLYIVTKGNHADYINPTMDGSISWRSIQSVGKIQRPLLKTGSRDDTKISQDDAPLFEKLGGLELKSVSIQYMMVSLIYALFWSKWKKKLGWNRGCRHLISLCDPPHLVGGPPTKVTCLHGRISSFPCSTDLSLLPKLVKTIETRN
jgi:hypothetical protein